MKALQDRVWDWYDEKFGHCSKSENLNRLTLWLSEEVGEVSKAFRHNNHKAALEEIGDVYLKLILLANLLGSSPETEAEAKMKVLEKKLGIKH